MTIISYVWKWVSRQVTSAVPLLIAHFPIMTFILVYGGRMVDWRNDFPRFSLCFEGIPLPYFRLQNHCLPCPLCSSFVLASQFCTLFAVGELCSLETSKHVHAWILLVSICAIQYFPTTPTLLSRIYPCPLTFNLRLCVFVCVFLYLADEETGPW